jgi:hypothetical protein
MILNGLHAVPLRVGGSIMSSQAIDPTVIRSTQGCEREVERGWSKRARAQEGWMDGINMVVPWPALTG